MNFNFFVTCSSLYRVAEAEVVNKIYEQGTHSDMRLQFEQQVHEVTEIADLKKLLTEMQSRRHFLREQIDRTIAILLIPFDLHSYKLNIINFSIGDLLVISF